MIFDDWQTSSQQEKLCRRPKSWDDFSYISTCLLITSYDRWGATPAVPDKRWELTLQSRAWSDWIFFFNILIPRILSPLQRADLKKIGNLTYIIDQLDLVEAPSFVIFSVWCAIGVWREEHAKRPSASKHVASYEQRPKPWLNFGYLLYRGDYTSQLHRANDKPLQGALWTNQTRNVAHVASWGHRIARQSAHTRSGARV